jgi:ATP-dependent RNA helicase DeaD
VDFIELGLSENIMKAIKDLGYESPTEIQEKAIPALLSGDRDFVGQAQTGTGKTAAFVIPLLENLDPTSGNVQALVLAPTRELALQVFGEVEKLAKYTGIKAVAIYGGDSYVRQKTFLKRQRPQIVIGTPGRVMDLINQGTLRFENSEYLILDEADEMLNMGFQEDVDKIMEAFKDNVKRWMFSATMPGAILNMISRKFKDPEVFKVQRKTLSNENIEQKFYLVQRRYHREALVRILAIEPDFYGLVFCRTRQDTQELAEFLLSSGYKVDMLHGDMGQSQRNASLQRFKEKKSQMMVCTDVASRGIDITCLTHVINYGVPQDNESYVHRIGRTGRAGQKGEAISLIDPRDLGYLRRIESYIKQKIEHCRLPTVQVLKLSKVKNELERMSSVIEAVVGKGDDYKMDQTFELFEENLKELTKDDLLKIMFTRSFNKDLQRYNDIGSLDEDVSRRSRNDRSDRSDRRSDGRRGDRRSDSRRGDRGGDRRSDRRHGDRNESRFDGRRGDRGDRRSDSRRGDSGDRRSRDDRRSDSPRERQSHVAKVGNVRLFLNAGNDDGIQMNSLLNDFSKATGIKAGDIQNVDIKNRFSFLEVPKEYGEKVINDKNLKINQRNVRLEYSK